MPAIEERGQREEESGGERRRERRAAPKKNPRRGRQPPGSVPPTYLPIPRPRSEAKNLEREIPVGPSVNRLPAPRPGLYRACSAAREHRQSMAYSSSKAPFAAKRAVSLILHHHQTTTTTCPVACLRTLKVPLFLLWRSVVCE